MQRLTIPAALLALSVLLPAQGFQRSSPSSGGSRSAPSAPRSSPSPSRSAPARSAPAPSRSSPAPRSSPSISRPSPSSGRSFGGPTTSPSPSRSMPARDNHYAPRTTPSYDAPSRPAPRSTTPSYVPPSRSRPQPGNSSPGYSTTPRYQPPTRGTTPDTGTSPRYDSPVRVRVGGQPSTSTIPIPPTTPTYGGRPVTPRYAPPRTGSSPLEPRTTTRDLYRRGTPSTGRSSPDLGTRQGGLNSPRLRDTLSERYRNRYENDIGRNAGPGLGRSGGDLGATPRAGGTGGSSTSPSRPGRGAASSTELGGHRYANPTRPSTGRPSAGSSSGDAPRAGGRSTEPRTAPGTGPSRGVGSTRSTPASPRSGAPRDTVRAAAPSLGATRTAKRVFNSQPAGSSYGYGYYGNGYYPYGCGYYGGWQSYCNYSSFCWGFGFGIGWYGGYGCNWGFYSWPFYWCWSWPSWYYDYSCGYDYYWSCHPYRRYYAPYYGTCWWYDPYWSSAYYASTVDVGYVPATREVVSTEPSPESLAAKYIALGDFYFKEGRFREAADNYMKALTWAPDDASLHFVLADALFALGDYHYAAFVIRKALRLDPGLARATTDKRTFYGDPKLFDAQLTTLRGYLTEKPYDAAAHLVHGYNLRFSGDPKGAEVALRRVLEIEPKDEAATLLLAELPRVEEPAGK